MMPIVLALLLSFLLAPLVKGLARLRVPSPLGAAVVLFAILGVVSLGLCGLWGPATQWIEQIPKSVGQIEAKIRPVRQAVEELSEAHHIRDEHLGRDRRQNRFLSIAFHVASGRTASAAALN